MYSFFHISVFFYCFSQSINTVCFHYQMVLYLVMYSPVP